MSLLVLHLLRVGKGCRSVGVWRDSLCGTVWAEGCLSRGDMMWCVCAEGEVVCVSTRLGDVFRKELCVLEGRWCVYAQG